MDNYVSRLNYRLNGNQEKFSCSEVNYPFVLIKLNILNKAAAGGLQACCGFVLMLPPVPKSYFIYHQNGYPLFSL